ncbi:MAG: threonylcarbamoyl-AMP synthase [Oligoflexales bacterium]|nr:threonylcarbamoyl-AMP synthase [Oligoflexales bacterium]
MQTLTFELTEQNLQEAIELAGSLLKRGEIVAVPSETVYGLAANAFNDFAVNKIYLAKGRPANNPLILHVAKRYGLLSELAKCGLIKIEDMSELAQVAAQNLMNLYWPGPLTLVLPRGDGVSQAATAGLQTVALRMPKHQFLIKLLENLEFPLAAPSANLSMATSPTSAQHVRQDLSEKIPLIIDAGSCKVGLESTILKISKTGQVKILRYGAITPDTLIQDGFIIEKETSELLTQKIEAPGMFALHYAPKAMFFYVKSPSTLRLEINFKLEKRCIVVIALSDEHESSEQFAAEVMRFFADMLVEGEIRFKTLYLDHGGICVENVARNLYSTLRQADALNPDLIVMQSSESTFGLWLAIHDRMKRAANK